MIILIDMISCSARVSDPAETRDRRSPNAGIDRRRLERRPSAGFPSHSTVPVFACLGNPTNARNSHPVFKVTDFALRRLLRFSRLFLPYMNNVLANLSHCPRRCFIFPESGIFRIPYSQVVLPILPPSALNSAH